MYVAAESVDAKDTFPLLVKTLPLGLCTTDNMYAFAWIENTSLNYTLQRNTLVNTFTENGC